MNRRGGTHLRVEEEAKHHSDGPVAQPPIAMLTQPIAWIIYFYNARSAFP